MDCVVATFYRFVYLPDCCDMRDVLWRFCVENGVRGTITLAEQGINATISGKPSAIEGFFSFLSLDCRLKDIEYHKSYAAVDPFAKMKVRLRNEVVRLGIEGFDCSSKRGKYVDPREWDDFISTPGVYAIDVRNKYEIGFGRFRGSISPETSSFREFPEWARLWTCGKSKGVSIAMYCTGGIRCEMSTAFMMQMGFENVYHLEGGILGYLQVMRGRGKLWEGECFVFDERVAVDSGMAPSHSVRCGECSGKVGIGGVGSMSKGRVLCRNCETG